MKYKIIPFIVLFSTILFAQKKKNIKTEVVAQSNHLSVYKLSKTFGDGNAAIVSLLYHLVENPKDTAIYYDTLSELYTLTRNYNAGYNLIKKSINSGKKEVFHYQVLAITAQKTNRLADAVLAYDVLYKQTSNLEYGYMLAKLYEQTDDNKKLYPMINSLLLDSNTNKLKVIESIDGQNNGEIPMSAALLNMRGILNYKAGDLAASKNDFKSALELFPQYLVPKRNLELLSAMEKEKK